MPTILTLTPNTLVDFLGSATVVSGRVNRVARLEPLAGGKGLNVARVLRRFGHRVIAAGFAGGFSGELLRACILGDGLEPLLVPTRARTRIGVQAIAPEGGTTSLLESGFTVWPEELAQLLAVVVGSLPGLDLVIAGGSVPDSSCTELFRLLLDACAKAGVPCWVDSYGAAMVRALAGPAVPAVCKPNREELAGAREAFDACPELHVTDGPRAVSVRSARGVFRVTPPRVREVNPVGSGDCYLAGLAHARLSGLDFERQLRFAAAAGAANAARADVAQIALEDVEPLVDRVQLSVTA